METAAAVDEPVSVSVVRRRIHRRRHRIRWRRIVRCMTRPIRPKSGCSGQSQNGAP